MRQVSIAASIVTVVAVTLITFVREKRLSGDHEKQISPITFQEVDREVQSNPSDSQIAKYSRQLRGTRIRWTGIVANVDDDRTVYVATNVYPTDVQFDLPRRIASHLTKGQRVTFTGAVERVSDAETFPPMFHAYVVLKDVKLE